ncbi:D-alanyl-D-alanine carboxypeptidase [Treponema sp. TIM-1]|uniref:D-alanyl-D-alanine carboxypeptidase family protein n=1 Tax=Treponema sp. TIM-1 TaxID=2898417 RepID=UPI00397EE4A2
MIKFPTLAILRYRAKKSAHLCFLCLFFTPFMAGALDPALDAPDIGSRAAVVLDALTGTVLYAKNGDEEIPPASLTKLMTIHLVLREAAARGISLEEVRELPRESWAVNQPPRSSLMFIGPGQRASIRDLLLGLAVPSGNDAAVAAALLFFPSVEEFIREMNREALLLGLTKTRFTEPSGISEYNITTAREFALFCREYLRMHPETLAELHSVREFAYPKPTNVGESFRDRPNTIIQRNHNALLDRVEGVDGLKTGYIDEAGYHIALTAERRGTRFIAVILGAPAAYGGDRIRNTDGESLLTWAFTHYKTLRPPSPVIPPARVWKGKENSLELYPAEVLECTALVDQGEGLHWEIELQDPVIAPIAAGAPLGELILYDKTGELRRIPLAAASEIEQGGFFKRLWDTIRLFFRGLFA